MPRLPLVLSAAASVAVAAVLGTATPALAKGGNPAPTPAPAPAPVLPDCFGDPAIIAMTTPDIAVNYAGEAGCVGVQSTGSTLRLAWGVLNPGWTYVVEDNGTGTNSRVQLQFTQPSTGQRIDFRFEFGKTVIG